MNVLATISLHTIWHYVWPPTAFQNSLIVTGFIATIYVAIAAMLLGIVLGVLAALGQLSRRRLWRALSRIYVTYFRGTPLLVQLSLLYFGLAGLGFYKFPDWTGLGITIPGVAQAGIIGLGVNKGAYMAEIVRAGIMSIDQGQTEAAKAIGMTRRQTMRRIILPQAARVIIPPTGNEFNAIIKDTTLIVTIGGIELFHAFEEINGQLFLPFELFFAMSLYYLALTMIWTAIQARIEKRLARGYQPAAVAGTRWRLRTALSRSA
jgi:polar amino acid transport system permease protein